MRTPTDSAEEPTLQMARTDRRSRLLQLRHTAGIKLALETVRETVDVAHRQFTATIEQFRRLALTGCTEETLRKYVSLVFAVPSDEAPVGVDTKDAGDETRSRVFPRVLRLFEEGRGTQIAGVRGTMWGAVNAVSEYVQYERGGDEARRLNGDKVVQEGLDGQAGVLAMVP
jgi:hypothetical protein